MPYQSHTVGTKSERTGTLEILFIVAQRLLALIALIVLVCMAIPFTRNALRPEPLAMPSTMEEVDWHAPESNVYCLACHKQIGLAVGGLEVHRGHSQNVALEEHQKEAIEAMGTVAGTGGTLICMSCHQLERDPSNAHMLAATVEGSELCFKCHPGHYAQDTPHDLRISAPNEVNRRGQTVGEAGPCSACHLSHGYARRIDRSPLDPEGYCLPCHSTYGIAHEHPRTRMDHPKSRCRECHDPHDATHGAFLKEPIDDLCMECHEHFDEGNEAGMHPVGLASYEIPQALLDAGAHLLDGRTQLTCVVCHDMHEANHTTLLHVVPTKNKLCLICHEDKLGEKTEGGMMPKHGRQPILDGVQRQVVARWGGVVGEKGELLCISCHDVHGAQPGTRLLRFQPLYGKTCSACHPDHEGVVGSAHDMRIEFPQMENAAGLNAMSAGVCSPCHMAHQFPRDPIASDADPQGVCTTCHSEGQCGQSAVIDGHNHPDTVCTDCHNPHQRRYEAFLIADAQDLCVKCHEAQSGVIRGIHDVRRNPSAWPERARTEARCLTCHIPHGGSEPGLMRMGLMEGANSNEAACLPCHEQAGFGATSAIAAIHPVGLPQELIEKLEDDQRWPFVSNNGTYQISCQTCHDPHGDDQTEYLMRAPAGERGERLCFVCHEDKALIHLTGHSALSLGQAGLTSSFCKPCHAMHASPDSVWGDLLSPRFLVEECDLPPGQTKRFLPCQACHREDGNAPAREFTQHPEIVTTNNIHPADPAYLPLFNDTGEADVHGQVTCRTCHLSHGRADVLKQLDSGGNVPEDNNLLRKAHVREFLTPNLCTHCHGEDAALLFNHYHDSTRWPMDFQYESVESAAQSSRS